MGSGRRHAGTAAVTDRHDGDTGAFPLAPGGAQTAGLSPASTAGAGAWGLPPSALPGISPSRGEIESRRGFGSLDI
ncbi:hypothetical protein CFBP6625_02940 [Agrobacterium tumefaciens]|nr:hypothetical protein CFBP6625_02940 [Agrobacterium tumefaciens]